MIFAMLVAPGVSNFCSPGHVSCKPCGFSQTDSKSESRKSHPIHQVTQDDQVESDDAGHCIGEEGRLHNLFP